MGYIARNLETNQVHFSKGANKLANIIGCNYSTITKFYQISDNKYKDKLIKGYIISETIDLLNQNRGNNIKFNV
jgi:DNA-binding transcriptional regulator LsrR (DeoR family)